MTTLPSDAAIKEALRRDESDEYLFESIKANPQRFLGLLDHARMIEEFQPHCLVDPEVVAVREAMALALEAQHCRTAAKGYRKGLCDDGPYFRRALAKFREVAEVKRKGAGE